MKKTTATKTTKTAVKETVISVVKDSTPLIPAEIKEKSLLQARTLRQIVTGSTNGKLQQRTLGSREFKNAFGHVVGNIGSKIDNLIVAGTCTKKEIEALAGTKMSKVNAHINHLRKDVKINVIINPVTKKVSIG